MPLTHKCIRTSLTPSHFTSVSAKPRKRASMFMSAKVVNFTYVSAIFLLHFIAFLTV